MARSINCRAERSVSVAVDRSAHPGSAKVASPMKLSTRRIGKFMRIASFVCATISLNALSGCAWTVISTVDAVGSVIQAGISISSNHSSPTFVNGDQVSLHAVCIEWNSMVAIGDFVPALQYALRQRGVRSTVYNSGSSPPTCEATLIYSASTDWGHRTFTDGYTPYLSAIDLKLIQGGKIVVVASYETNGAKLDRFASTATKITALINKMVMATSN